MRRGIRRERRASVGSVVVWIVVLAGALAWFEWARPASLGGDTAFIMVSGESMEPTIESGDLAVVRARDTYEAGDVVAFVTDGKVDPQGPFVVHRITEELDDGTYRLQGDNNPGEDPWNPAEDGILGEYVFHLPGAAEYLAVLRQPHVFASVLAGLTVFLIMLGPEKSRGSRPATAENFKPADRREPASRPERAPVVGTEQGVAARVPPDPASVDVPQILDVRTEEEREGAGDTVQWSAPSEHADVQSTGPVGEESGRRVRVKP